MTLINKTELGPPNRSSIQIDRAAPIAAPIRSAAYNLKLAPANDWKVTEKTAPAKKKGIKEKVKYRNGCEKMETRVISIIKKATKIENKPLLNDKKLYKSPGSVVFLAFHQ